jgi:hypothetical protein
MYSALYFCRSLAKLEFSLQILEKFTNMKFHKKNRPVGNELFVCLLHQGPVALQPLGLFYALFSRSSHCRRQMSPRPTRREGEL